MSSHADTISRGLYAGTASEQKLVNSKALDALLAENRQLREVERIARSICVSWAGCRGEIDGDDEFAELSAALAAVVEE